MPVMSVQNPTLLDVVQRMDPDGKLPIIAEMLTRVNPILQDMPMIEGNLQTGHQGTIRTGLPTAYWRLLNQGTPPSKSTTKHVVDTCGIMEQFSEIDKVLFELNGAKDAFRLSEDRAHIEGMSQELATTVFYGNTQTNPEKFLGLAPRFSDRTGPENANQIINGGGTTPSVQSSIWLIAWDESTIHGIYPKDTMGGLQVENLGEETKEASDGRLMRVLRSHFIHRVGLHMKDWEGVVRIANVEVGVTPSITDSMIDAWYQIPLRLRGKGRLAFYMNPSIKAALVKLAKNTDTINQFTFEQLERGEPLMRFWGVPVRECDALTSTEEIVS